MLDFLSAMNNVYTLTEPNDLSHFRVLNSDAKVTIDVKAREAGSVIFICQISIEVSIQETFYYVGSQEINAYPEVKKLRMKLDTELMKRLELSRK